MALRCRQKRCFRVTTDSEHMLPVADNLLLQDFTASAPDQLWLTCVFRPNVTGDFGIVTGHSGRT